MSGALLSRRRVTGLAAASTALLLPGVAPSPAATIPALVLDDASRLDPTRVARHVLIGPDPDRVMIERLRSELRDAAAAGRPVALGVARHSMGGQSLALNGTALTFQAGAVLPDRAAGLYRAAIGARWRDVIATLDPLGYSPAVMQSNHDFGVTSTFSVNAHGWAVPHGPFGSTVQSLRLMLADGQVVTCTPTENPGLFHAAMGGYGLFGIILDVDAAMVPNQLLQPRFHRMPGAEFAARFVDLCTSGTVPMAYGRIDISTAGLGRQALMIGYHPVSEPPAGLPPAGTGGLFSSVSRVLYRAQVDDDPIKRARWFIETEIAPGLLEGQATRNALLNEPVSNLAGTDLSRTDILHEYFVPPDAFPAFLEALHDVIPRFHQELLNVTLRFVEPDRASLLAYAAGRRIAAVMSFSQRMTQAAEDDMRLMTQTLIDRVLDLGGCYYLPYRLHARPDQFARAYPAHQAFAEAKRRADAGLLFRNALWDTYLAQPASKR